VMENLARLLFEELDLGLLEVIMDELIQGRKIYSLSLFARHVSHSKCLD
jgi:hypothetical protein